MSDITIDAAPAQGKPERFVVVSRNGVGELHRDTLDLNSATRREKFVTATMKGAYPGTPAEQWPGEVFDALKKRLASLAAVPPGGGLTLLPALTEETADSKKEARGGLPRIVHNRRQYRDVEADAMAALIAANDPPRVFVGNGCGLVDIPRPTPDAELVARELDPAALRPVFAQVADWVVEKELPRGHVEEEGDFPPTALLSSFPARGEWPGVPHPRSIVTYPVFGPGWQLVATPGYHAASGIYCDTRGLVLPLLPESPTADDVAEAKRLIQEDLLGDFPFVDEASRANAVANLITPTVRHAIDGPTPLGVIDAPMEGTGKSLFAEAITLATVGEEPEAISPDMSDEEWNKTLLALLIAGQPVIYLDNANRKLDSASLASALTARYKKGRILGETQMARARINVCWLLTANNFKCSREIARRCYWTRIDRGVANPSSWTGYRHPDLLGWVRANRNRLLWAVGVLVRNWLAAGSPAGTQVMGKFEAWCEAVGGILKAAGIEKFLGNSEEFRRQCGDESGELAEFVRVWWDRHGGNRVIAGDLYDVAKDILDTVLTSPTEEGKRRQLGKYLSSVRDRVEGGFRIRAALKEDGKEDRDYAQRPRYVLEQVESGGKQKHTKKAPSADYSDEEFCMTV